MTATEMLNKLGTVQRDIADIYFEFRFDTQLQYKIGPSTIQATLREIAEFTRLALEEITPGQEPQFTNPQPNDGPARLSQMLPRVGNRKIN